MSVEELEEYASELYTLSGFEIHDMKDTMNLSESLIDTAFTAEMPLVMINWRLFRTFGLRKAGSRQEKKKIRHYSDLPLNLPSFFTARRDVYGWLRVALSNHRTPIPMR